MGFKATFFVVPVAANNTYFDSNPRFLDLQVKPLKMVGPLVSCLGVFNFS